MRKSTAILWLAMAALAAISIWLWRAFDSERARANSLQARIVEAESLAAAEMQNVIASDGSAPDDTHIVQEKLGALQPKKKVDFSEWERRQLQNESYREARRRFRQLELAGGYIDFAKVLGISQETADRVIALLVEAELDYLMSEASRNPRNEKEMRIRQMENQQAQHERELEIAAIIGAANLPRWKEYQASLSVRHEVYELGAMLFATGEPLHEDKVEPLIEIIHSERQRARQELTEFTQGLTWSGGMEAQSHAYRNERRAELTRAAHERIHTEASSILSMRQLQVLDDLMRRERELQDAELEVLKETDRVSGGSG